jgi:hypothetical protein
MTRDFLLLALGLFLASCGEDRPVLVKNELRSTWGIIQEDIFAARCVGCHTTGTSFAEQSALVLTADVAYSQLVGQAPANEVVKAEGLMRVSDQGQLPGLLRSYLWEKVNAPDQEHFFGDHPYYGALMPLGGQPLSNGELAFLRAWIEAGAPETGAVADPALLVDESYYERPEFKPLPKPENGIQFHLGPFDVQPNFERELFSMVALDNDEELFVERFEISMQSGSHHFLLYSFQDETPAERMPAPNEIRDLRDEQGVYVFDTVRTMLYHQPIVGSQWPFFDFNFPAGVAMRLPKGMRFDLNSHYINRTDEPTVGEAYLNLHYADPAKVQHEAKIFGLSNFDIALPAGKVTTLSEQYRFPERMHIIQLMSHAHEHMTEFRVELMGGDRDGEVVYIAYDWEHPPILELDPPLVVEPGQGFKVEATYDNWTDRELNFGFLSEDEMMILYGFFYTD